MKSTVDCSKTYNSYVHNNVNVSYLKKNFASIIFQLWFSPTLLLLFVQGSYYENNNDYKMIEHIRNYEIVNLLLEYGYINPYVVRSSMILHHVMAIINTQIFVLLQNENVPMIRHYAGLANLAMTTTLLLDMVNTFHKNTIFKIMFIIYFFVLRIVIPFPFLVSVSTGQYLTITPSEYIPVTVYLSIGMYIFYGLNIFWFYKLCRIARKHMLKNKKNKKVLVNSEQ
jgi:hypothetical protein